MQFPSCGLHFADPLCRCYYAADSGSLLRIPLFPSSTFHWTHSIERIPLSVNQAHFIKRISLMQMRIFILRIPSCRFYCKFHHADSIVRVPLLCTLHHVPSIMCFLLCAFHLVPSIMCLPSSAFHHVYSILCVLLYVFHRAIDEGKKR